MNRSVLALLASVAAVATAHGQPFHRMRGHQVAPPPPPVWVAPAPIVQAPVLVREDVILRWNEVALDAIRAEKAPPPIAAHHLALLHIAMFDAVNAIDNTHTPFVAKTAPPANTSAAAAASVAAHRMLTALFNRQSRMFDSALNSTLAAMPTTAAKVNGMNFGHAVALDVINWRRQNGQMQHVSYKVALDTGHWRPTPPDFRPPLLPEWCGAPCLALRDPTKFRAPGPPDLSSKDYLTAYDEVRLLGGTDSRTRTRDQTEIAHFWADGEGTATPPGHWNQIAASVSRQRGLTLAQNARLFACLNVAMADAAIACWECKFKTDLWRPVTAIREKDPNWTPLLTTPPFPSYTSGHSTFSGAAAAALASFFGTDEVRFTTTSDAMPGVRRSFVRFSDAAAEAGMSRIYGGIHWQFDNTDGLKLGRSVGEYVAANYFQPKALR